MNVLILGVNGFIGSHLAERILRTTDWEIAALDPFDHHLENCLENPRFHFRKNSMEASWDWIADRIQEADVVVPLAGIAQPALYIKNPLLIFELDFNQNLKVVRLCAKFGKRVVFPSTSEVYGMSPDPVLKEDESLLVLGPICKSRWIYSCGKQMMDRVIAAMGQQMGLPYTLFRPFNWIGPRQDSLKDPELGQSRVLTQFIYNVLHDRPIHLVGGGEQRRSFTDIEDGIDCLMKILENEKGVADGDIFNIGNPENHLSIRELAYRVRETVASFPGHESARQTPIVEVEAEEYYGEGYQDVEDRLPSIEKARRLLGWAPRIPLDETLRRTVRYFLEAER